ncbi:polysaccharide deacetylase family protein [Lacibacterium aquatile]|uniref:Chitooligosaccharide deacetylase n=1 Tax=Lacibacterium aquatile TaxID=1168082 RepID=A0ABW5DT70_9PROT
MLARLRQWIGIGVLAGCLLSPAVAFAQQADSLLPRAVILTYGRFNDDSAASSISTELFEAHLAELSAGGYQVWPLSRLVAAITDAKPIPEKTVVLTIDEPHVSAFTVAWPLLRQYGFPATLFLATDTVDRASGETLSWSQIRTMANNGIEIGNQTASHPHLINQDRAYIIGQIARANDRIKAETGTTPTMLAYPYGEYSDAVRDYAKGQGMRGAVGQQSGVAHARSDVFTLPRFAMNDTLGSQERFRLAVQALPLLVGDVTPGDMRLGENPPSVGFTVDPMMGDLSGLSCFLSGVGRINAQSLGERRIELRFDDALPAGRSRLNCTLPASEGRWRWFGMMLVAN